jgi:hypothetical protein
MEENVNGMCINTHHHLVESVNVSSIAMQLPSPMNVDLRLRHVVNSRFKPLSFTHLRTKGSASLHILHHRPGFSIVRPVDLLR